MAKVIIENGFSNILLNDREALEVDFGLIEKGKHITVCCRCNEACEDQVYYIPALNDCMCEKCYQGWIKKAKYYPEDRYYEKRNFDHIAEELGLELM
jgi:hypothetical protein